MYLLCSAAKKQNYVIQNYVVQVNVFVVAAYFPENLIWGSYNCINYSECSFIILSIKFKVIDIFNRYLRFHENNLVVFGRRST